MGRALFEREKKRGKGTRERRKRDRHAIAGGSEVRFSSCKAKTRDAEMTSAEKGGAWPVMRPRNQHFYERVR